MSTREQVEQRVLEPSRWVLPDQQIYRQVRLQTRRQVEQQVWFQVEWPVAGRVEYPVRWTVRDQLEEERV